MPPSETPRRIATVASFALLLAIAALLGISLAAASLHAHPVAASATTASGTLRVEKFHSRALEGNLLGDPAEQPFAIYLPPAYATQPARRFPVLYLLHGVGGTFTDWTRPGYQGMTIQSTMDSLIAAGAIREFIVVVPNGRNRYMGSYYANSPVTGNWADYVWRDLVRHVDSTFRTLPRRESRGIAGHSMGGLGSLTLAMEHPEVFGSCYALSPCCLDATDDISAENPAWARAMAFTGMEDYQRAVEARDFYPMVMIGLLAAIDPQPARPPFFVEFPVKPAGDRLIPAEPAFTRFRNAFPTRRIAARAENLKRLRGLRLDYGPRDQFPHIPPSTLELSQELARHGVPHALEVFDGDHRNRMRERMSTVILPFFHTMLAE